MRQIMDKMIEDANDQMTFDERELVIYTLLLYLPVISLRIAMCVIHLYSLVPARIIAIG